MKHLLTIAIALIIISCSSNENQVGNTVCHDSIPWRCVDEFKYKGHSYIKFLDAPVGSYRGYAGVVHNPECECFKDSVRKDSF